MSLWLILKCSFFIIYSSICAYLAYIIYKNEKKFYQPLYVKKKTGEGKEEEVIVNIHDEFDEFTRRDNPVSYLQLFCGIFTLFFIKLFSSFYFGINFSRKLKKLLKEKEDKKESFTNADIKSIRESEKYNATNFLHCSGIFFRKRRLPDNQILAVYKKYFGPDYKIEYEGKFGCYISNHTSFNDILLSMAIYGCGFISKEDVKTTPIIGDIAKGLQSIFVNRNNTASRENTLEKIIERQKEYIEGKPVMPFMIFPEATTSSGRHLLSFKRGAFFSLLPIKPNIILPNLNSNFHLGCGATNAGINYGRTLTNLYARTDFIELPIMTPNEYMYNNFSNYGKEKWEIYKEVAREIMCTLGGFEKSDKEFIDSDRYIYCIKNKVFIEKEKFLEIKK